MPTSVRRFFDGLSLLCALVVAVGVWVQVYLIGSYFFGADALDAHRTVGFIVHSFELLCFLGALVAWHSRRATGLAFALGALGTVQLAFSDGEEWVGGLHALFALIVLVLASLIVRDGVARRRVSA